MDKAIKILKIVFLLIAIFIGLVILVGALFILKGVKSGNLQQYIAKTAIETLAPDTKLTQEQQEMLDSGDFEGLANEIEKNATPEQIDCATQVLGKTRAAELLVKKDPTPQEILKLSNCLK